MCAIAGIVYSKDPKALPKMLSILAHRGPDDHGEYHDHLNHVSLGHRRLSILDLSTAGHQPMIDSSGNIVVVFNGEIYNYLALQRDLEKKGYVFRSKSDTEVILHGYVEYGAEIFKKLDGMWAIAVYDRNRKTISLSRDPAGMKPLYLYHTQKMLAFASEIGALSESLPSGSLNIDQHSIGMFLSHRYIYGEQTIFTEIKQISPATTVTINLVDMKAKSEINYVPQKTYEAQNISSTTEEFLRRFNKSVAMTLQSDVPVALFLSGGVDSSLVANAVTETGNPLQSFTVSFDSDDFSEANIASAVAKHLGLKHTVWNMSARDVQNDIIDIIDSFGQPFGDMSSIPTYYAARMAKLSGHKVVLTGDGADELFGGYPTHYLPSISKLYQNIPSFADQLLVLFAGSLSSRATKLGLREKIERFLSGARLPFPEAHATWKRIFTKSDLELLIDHSELNRMRGTTDINFDFERFMREIKPFPENNIDAVIKTDFATFLTADCLVKSDISSMKNGIELRSPFLNKDIIDFAWYLPTQMKTSPFHTKILLRRAMIKILPKHLSRLPKQGFVPPLALWFRGEMKQIITDILSKNQIAKIGYMKYNYVASLIDEHLSGQRDHAAKLFCLMALVRFHIRNA